MLGLNITHNKEYVLNEISKYLFDSKSSSSGNKERNFDLNLDYKYYFVDFLRFNVNLNKDDIDWWEFNTILDAIILDDNSTMSKVLSYRTYTKPSKSIKTQEENRHRFMIKMKNKYKLPIEESEIGLNKLWSYLEQKVGDNNV